MNATRSFMVPWNAIFSIFSGSSLLATAALFFLITKVKGTLVLQDAHCTAETFWKSLLLTGLCSIIAVLILQAVANFAFNMAFAGNDSTSTLRASTVIARNKGGLAILVITLLVGGGYAFSFVVGCSPPPDQTSVNTQSSKKDNHMQVHGKMVVARLSDGFHSFLFGW
jgi:hypothetical protein